MLLTHKINIPIYNQHVWIIVGDPYEAQDYLRDCYCGDYSFDPNSTNAICLHSGTVSWIWLAQDVTFAILVHELSHAVFDLMNDLGLDKSDQEAFCYLLEYLINECKDIFAIRMDPIKQV